MISEIPPFVYFILMLLALYGIAIIILVFTGELEYCEKYPEE